MPTRPLLVLSAALALSGCATFTNADAVATVDGEQIDEEEFSALAAEFAERGDIFQTTAPAAGRVSADQTRFLLGVVIRQQALRHFLDDAGIDATSLRDTFIDTGLAGTPLSTVSRDLQEVAADIDEQLIGQAVADIPAPDVDELRAIYADRPARTGLACVRHILVATEQEADAVVAELDGGADFAELARSRSVDTTSAQAGGAITGGPGTGECLEVQTLQQGFVAPFVEATIDGREGVPIGPVETQFGWHVIEHRPWDEVAATMTTLHQSGLSGALLFEGHLATVDVDVDPRLGRWNPATLTVDPIG